ncbi:hypothetical protein EG68_04311 [Paragonimus skrjabini miyazakii]|uniref:Uncharacterized protein n=1 Tax=Paragonimus skrjabini miyazakii TaxID=59628 RepID=A0A8S9YUJ9_9TREM|nr:hypothetical protein EG68_04311 [Paragonimus skrjabini miyazakii]
MGHGSSTLCAHIETKDQQGNVEANSSTTKSSKPTQDTKTDTKGDFGDMSKQPIHRTEDTSEDSQRAEDNSTSQGSDPKNYGETNQHAHECYDKMYPVNDFCPEQLSEVCIPGRLEENSKPKTRSDQHNHSIAEGTDHSEQRCAQQIAASRTGDRTSADDGETSSSIGHFDEPPIESPNSLAGRSSGRRESCISIQTSLSNRTSGDKQTSCIRDGPQETETHSVRTPIPDIPRTSVDLYSLKNIVYSPIKLPDVNEVTNSVRTALAIRSPLSGYKVITVESKDEQSEDFSEMDPSNMLPKPLSETQLTSIVLVDQYSERYRTFSDASVLIISEKQDADTSMYACAEGINDESVSLLAEMADPINFSEDDDPPTPSPKAIPSEVNSNPTTPPVYQANLKKRRKSVWVKTTALAKVLKLPITRRANSLPSTQHESDSTKLSVCNDMIHFNAQAMKRYSNKNTDCSGGVKTARDTTSAIRTQIEKSSWYSDISLTAGDSAITERKYSTDTETYLPNSAKNQMELETREEMIGDVTDGPHSIDLLWEAQIHTPSVLDSPPAQANQVNECHARNSRITSVADGELYATHRSSAENIQAVYSNLSHVRQTDEIARRRLQSLPNQKDLVRTPALELCASQLVGSQVVNIYKQLDRRSMGAPHFLQSLQSSDDFGVLLEEEGQPSQNISVENNNMKELTGHKFISSRLWSRRYHSRLQSNGASTNGNNCSYVNADILIQWDDKEDNSEACIESSTEMIFVDSPTCLDCLPIRMNS